MNLLRQITHMRSHFLNSLVIKNSDKLIQLLEFRKMMISTEDARISYRYENSNFVTDISVAGEILRKDNLKIFET